MTHPRTTSQHESRQNTSGQLENSQPIAVIGATGQVSRALQAEARARRITLAVAGRPGVDLSDAEGVTAFLSAASPRAVVNAAAYTAVDKAEAEAALAHKINAEGPGVLAAWCARAGVPLFHISTDYVFDGRASQPYREDALRNPLSVYGRSKSAGEDAVRAALDSHIIIRTAWIYSAEGQNFLRTMMRLGGERDVVRVVADQFGTPTAAADIAGAIFNIADMVDRGSVHAPWGTYHLVAGGSASWHDFAQVIFSAAAAVGLKTPRLEAISTADYPAPAARPAYGVLDTTKISDVFGIQLPPWQQHVADCVRLIAS